MLLRISVNGRRREGMEEIYGQRLYTKMRMKQTTDNNERT